MVRPIDTLARIAHDADVFVASSPRMRGWETVRSAGLLVAYAAFALALGTGAPTLLLGLCALAMAVLYLAPRRSVEPTASLADVTEGWDDEAPISNGDSREVAPMSGVRATAQEADNEVSQVSACGSRR